MWYLSVYAYTGHIIAWASNSTRQRRDGFLQYLDWGHCQYNLPFYLRSNSSMLYRQFSNMLHFSQSIHKNIITACAVATSCCISDLPRQWEGQKFDPPQLPHFSTDLSETQNQERYPGYDLTCKIWLTWDDGKRICESGEFWLTFGSFFFCTFSVLFALRPDHTVRPIATNEGSKRVFLRKEVPFGGLDDKK